jgi:hypothetical protein
MEAYEGVGFSILDILHAENQDKTLTKKIFQGATSLSPQDFPGKTLSPDLCWLPLKAGLLNIV